jgi:hypothetical protein
MKIATIRQNPELCFLTSLQAGVNFDSEMLGGAVMDRCMGLLGKWASKIHYNTIKSVSFVLSRDVFD